MTLFYIVKSTNIRKKPDYEGRLWFPKDEQVVTRPWESQLCRDSFRVFVIRERGKFNIKVSECSAAFRLWMRVFHAATYDTSLMFQCINTYRCILMDNMNIGELIAREASTPRVVIQYMKGEYSEKFVYELLSIYNVN